MATAAVVAVFVGEKQGARRANRTLSFVAAIARSAFSAAVAVAVSGAWKREKEKERRKKQKRKRKEN